VKASRKWILCSLIVVTILVFGFAGRYLWRLAQIGAAYKAKVLCSGVFVSKRDPDSILNNDLLVDDLSIFRHLDTAVDYNSQSVRASFMGLAHRKAIYRPGLGCTLLIDISEKQLRSQTYPRQIAPASDRQYQLWPGGKRTQMAKLPPEVDSEKLNGVIDKAFSEPDPHRLRRTRAVVVIYDGRIIAERYAPGFSQDTPLLGWSMTKSVMNALIGILVRQGKLSPQDKALVPAWCAPGDSRGKITIDQLLRMTSGLKFAEDYTNPRKDVIYMLLGTGDMSAFAMNKPLEAEPGSKWYYSSGTTNIIARILRDAIGGSDADYLAFPNRELFDRIGMHSAIIEPDAAGIFVGSSFMYATARDWGRFGLFCLQDGVWNGERILPEGWMQYTLTPTRESPNDEYGAHFWLKIPPSFYGGVDQISSLPADTYFALGHEGQAITIIPSRKVVVVRLGLTRLPGAWNQELFAVQILDAIESEKSD